jgi:hypothetical protein
MSSQLAERITHLPKFYEAGEKSTATLLQEAGLPDTGSLPAEEVEEVLRRDPDLTDLWLERGSDQRLARGWGIERDINGTYQLQNFSNGTSIIEHSRTRACAQFIVRYVGVIGDVLTRKR